MPLSYVALGANVAGPYGPPDAAIDAALGRLNDSLMHVVASSARYHSPAWPDPADPEFTNGVALIDTDLSPSALLARLHAIETDFGRVRRRLNAPRPLDLDIVDYDARVSADGENPVLPHPRLATRAFVLLPLAEIAPDWRHPVTGEAIASLISALPRPIAAWRVS